MFKTNKLKVIFRSNYFLKNQLRNFAKTENYDFNQRMKIIVTNLEKEKEDFGGDLKYTERKIQPIFSSTEKFQKVMYISLIPLALFNPFSAKYTFCVLFSNYFLITLTGIEVISLFLQRAQ